MKRLGAFKKVERPTRSFWRKIETLKELWVFKRIGENFPKEIRRAPTFKKREIQKGGLKALNNGEYSL